MALPQSAWFASAVDPLVAIERMIQEKINYKDNIQRFLNEIEGKLLRNISFFIDTQPTFDLSAVPFEFSYAFSIVIYTDQNHYWLHTAMTSTGINTFWVEKNKNFEEFSKPDFERIFNEKILSTTSENGLDDFYFKIHIKTKDSDLIFYVAEIYDNADGTIDYRMNDGMTFVFQNTKEAEKFERLINKSD